MADIDDFLEEAKKKSPFVQFEDGEPIRGVLIEKKLVDDTFNPNEKVLQYTIEIDGKEKSFKSKSVNLAKMMKPIKNGEEVEIVRTGTKFNTNWYVKSLTKQVEKKEEE